MAETAGDYELFHHGIKGMKWGRRRKDTNGDGRVDGGGSAPKRRAALQKAHDDDDKAMADYKTARTNFKNNKKDPNARKALNESMEKADKTDDALYKAQQADKAQTKSNRKELRKEVYKNVNQTMRTARDGSQMSIGRAAVKAFVNPISGIKLSVAIGDSAGISRGKSVALTMLGGSAATAAAAEVKIRRDAKR